MRLRVLKMQQQAGRYEAVLERAQLKELLLSRYKILNLWL
jgi:hypothetical protein